MSEETIAADLDRDDERALSCVLDEIIPPSADGRLPGAGELGLVAVIREELRKSPDLRLAVTQGLAALGTLSKDRGGAFSELEARDRLEVMNELVAAQPAFLPGLIFHTYCAYYQAPRVVEGLGLEARPPHPQGYTLEPGDLGLLDPVRRRAPMYRDPCC
jgi:hypothetical protein